MRIARALASVLGVLTVGLLAGASPAAAAGGHTLIEGSGSSWAANAVNQWIADVHANGLQVVFSSTGSAQGRQDYANVTTDFAISDIGYQGTDPATGAVDNSQGRSYAYLPIVAGGTALPYQIRVAGNQVRNLRLSGPTIAKIFSQQITNWDDPAITRDNNGHALPSLTIIPVVHSEGSGSTYQFTRYLAKQFPSIWGPFSSVGATEYFPKTNGSAVRQNGSDSVMNFLTSGAANGAIGYDEYSYALGKNYPVVKVLNSGGYYTLPNQYNVAVALTKAVINPDSTSKDYLLQNLDSVYGYSDTRVYPISSYSYALIPYSATDARMTTAKRQTLVDYLDYSVCQGQAEMGRIGYSPLPINLVQASFAQVSRLHTADPMVDVTRTNVADCHNPTFISGHPTQNYLAQVAPRPEACDKVGAGPCTDAGFTGQQNPQGGAVKVTTRGTSAGTTVAVQGKSGGTHAGSTGTTAGTQGTKSTVAGTRAVGTGSRTDTIVATKINPQTGQLVAVGNDQAAGGTGALAAPQPTVLASAQSKNTDVTLEVLAGALLIAVLIIPPAVSLRIRRGAGPS